MKHPLDAASRCSSALDVVLMLLMLDVIGWVVGWLGDWLVGLVGRLVWLVGCG